MNIVQMGVNWVITGIAVVVFFSLLIMVAVQFAKDVSEAGRDAAQNGVEAVQNIQDGVETGGSIEDIGLIVGIVIAVVGIIGGGIIIHKRRAEYLPI